LVRAHR